MRAILIDPQQRTVTEIEVQGKDYTELYGILDCDIFTSSVRFETEDMMLIDDEGLFKEPEDFFILTQDFPAPIAGKAVILGTDDEGDTAPCLIPLERITKQISWASRNEARMAIRAQREARSRMKAEYEKAGVAFIDVNMDDYFDEKKDK